MSLIYNSYLNDFFNDSYFNTNKFKGGKLVGTNNTKCNVYRDKKNLFFDLSLPGFSKDDFNISIENSVLTIYGKTVEDTKKDYIHQEFTPLNVFKRSFSMPENINIEQVDAKYEAGILSVTIPFLEEKKTVTKNIEVR